MFQQKALIGFIFGRDPAGRWRRGSTGRLTTFRPVDGGAAQATATARKGGVSADVWGTATPPASAAGGAGFIHPPRVGFVGAGRPRRAFDGIVGTGLAIRRVPESRLLTMAARPLFWRAVPVMILRAITWPPGF